MELSSYSGMICSFLDGELDASSEESLFHALANAPDLRAEMREHLSIRSAILSDIEAYTPPIESAGLIFNRLGLNFPLQSNAKIERGIRNLRTVNLAVGVLIAVIASLITGIAVRYAQDSKLNDIVTLGNTTISNNRSVAILQSPLFAEPAVAPNAIKRNDRRINNASYNYSSIRAAVNDKASSTDSRGASIVQTLPYSRTPSVNIFNTQVADADKNIAVLLPDNTLSTYDGYPQFWMQVRGLAPLTSPPSQLLGANMSPYDNIAVSGYYKLSDVFSLGVEIGRENYALHYYGRTENIDATYNQAAPLLFGGITAQYTLKPLSSLGNASPYIALSGGGAEIGPYARGSVGVYYPLSQTFGMTLGGDISAVFFQFQGPSFDSWKTSVFYGFAFQF